MLNAILSALSNPAVITVAALIIESVLHMVPSQKPLGILHGLSLAMDKIASGAAAVASFLDKVIPQNVVQISASNPTDAQKQG